MTVDAGDSAMLVLLDLTAACDTIDHTVLLSWLEEYVVIQGKALSWLYLTARSMAVSFGSYTSSSASLICGVPQGSILCLAPTCLSDLLIELSEWKNIEIHNSKFIKNSKD